MNCVQDKSIITISIFALCFNIYGYVNLNKEHYKEKLPEILDRYEHSIDQRKCLFFPAQNPKQLVICFSAMHKTGYSMWSWFYNEAELWPDTAYLFLNESTEYFYLGPENKPSEYEYKTIIDYFLKKSGLTPDCAISIGHSMGGYAALYYAVTLGFKAAIVSNPIVYSDGQRYKNIINTIGENWKNIPDLLIKQKKLPHIFLQFGNHAPDRAHAQLLIRTYQETGGCLIIKHFPSIDEHGTLSLQGDLISELIKFFSIL